MKFLTTGLIGALLAFSTQSALVGRNLQVDNCAAYDASGNCTGCYFRYVLVDGQCNAVSDQCKTWDASSGACTSCYDGWTLSNGACTIGGGENPPPSSECGFRHVKVNGECKEVSDQCKTWDGLNGDCISCYDGWTLSEGACVIGDGQTPPPNSQCGFRHVKVDGVCKQVSDQCKTWDGTTGDCTSCYEGWALEAGACVVDLGGPTAGDCPFKNVKVNGQCQPVNEQCKTWDQTGACTSCYDGWTLSNGDCIV